MRFESKALSNPTSSNWMSGLILFNASALTKNDADALKRIKPDMRFDEVGFLSAFDSNRKLIYATAAKVYGRRRKGSYDLIAADF